MGLEMVIPVLLAIAVWPLSMFARKVPDHWRCTVYGSLAVYFLAFAFVSPDHRIISIILACVGIAAAFKSTETPA